MDPISAGVAFQFCSIQSQGPARLVCSTGLPENRVSNIQHFENPKTEFEMI